MEQVTNMNAKSRIQKGKRAENEVSRRIERAGLGRSCRTPGSGSGNMKADLFNNLPFTIEVKNQKSIHFLDWVKQSKEQAKIGSPDPNKWALVIIDPQGVQDPERMEIYAVTELDEWLELIKRHSEPKIKEPDRKLKYLLESLKTSLQKVERDPEELNNKFFSKRIIETTKKVIKELN